MSAPKPSGEALIRQIAMVQVGSSAGEREAAVQRTPTRAADLQASDLGEIVGLPTVSYDIAAGGSLEKFEPVAGGIKVTVRSRGDGSLNRHVLADDDEVVIYRGARAKQDAAPLPPVMAEILAGSLTPTGIEQWFAAPNRLLKNQSPQAAMRAGQYQQVMAAAQSFAEAFYG